jgi:hypothetical protein
MPELVSSNSMQSMLNYEVGHTQQATYQRGWELRIIEIIGIKVLDSGIEVGANGRRAYTMGRNGIRGAAQNTDR